MSASPACEAFPTQHFVRITKYYWLFFIRTPLITFQFSQYVHTPHSQGFQLILVANFGKGFFPNVEGCRFHYLAALYLTVSAPVILSPSSWLIASFLAVVLLFPSCLATIIRTSLQGRASRVQGPSTHFILGWVFHHWPFIDFYFLFTSSSLITTFERFHPRPHSSIA